MRDLAVRAGSFLAGDVAARGLAFLVLIFGARRLGPREFGMFALVYGAVAIGLLISDLGLTPLVLRKLSGPGRLSRRIFWSGAVTNFVLGSLSYLVLLGGFAAIAPRYVGLAMIYGPVLLIQSIASSSDAVLLASSRAPRLGVIRASGNTALLIAAVPLVSLKPSAASLGAAFALGSAVKCLLSVATVRGLIGRPQFSLRLTRTMLGKAMPFAGAALASYLYFRVDVLLVAALATQTALGVYAGAYRFIDGLILIPGALAYVAFPEWIRRGATHSNAGQTLKSVVALVIFVVAAGEGLAPGIVHLLLGPSFAGSSDVLQILLLGVPILYADVILVWLAYAYHRERLVVAVGIVALVANIGANIVLIPYFGARGAAVATVGSEAVNLVGYTLMFRRELAATARVSSRVALQLVALAGAVTPILVMQEMFLPPEIGTPLAVMLFAVAAWAVGLFKPRRLIGILRGHEAAASA